MKREGFQIDGTTVPPGERAIISMPLARLYTQTDVTLPIHVLHGRRPGPTLFVSAAIHGDELNGIDIIRRLLKLKLLDKIHGTLIAIPVVNVFGLLQNSRYLPDRRDLNRYFPGSSKGSLTGRLANFFLTQIVSRCTHGIDLHTGSNHRINLPQIRAWLSHEETYTLATAFGAPVMINSEPKEGTLRKSVVDLDIPILLYEAGEALRFDERSIRTGVRGILNVMRALGMLPPAKAKTPHTPSLEANQTYWVRAPHSGIHTTRAWLGAMVEKDQILSSVCDPFGKHETPIPAPTSGIIIGGTRLPLVYQGDALFHIATIDPDAPIPSYIDSFAEEGPNDDDNFFF